MFDLKRERKYRIDRIRSTQKNPVIYITNHEKSERMWDAITIALFWFFFGIFIGVIIGMMV